MDIDTADENASEEVLLGGSNNEELSNEDAVSLFSTSMKKALQQQNEVIVSSIVKQINDQSCTSRDNMTEHGENERVGYKFEFKHEGHLIQHSFNSVRIKKLKELKSYVLKNDLERASMTIDKEIAELNQRNKILKIVDRHGWDMVNEYLDDPLADNNDDAVKLRGKPYAFSGQNRRQSAFSDNDFFCGFSQTFTPASRPVIPERNSSNASISSADKGGIMSWTVPSPEDKCQELPRSHRPPVLTNSEDKDEYNCNNGCVEDSYEYEQNTKSFTSGKSRLKNHLQFWKDGLYSNQFVQNTIEFGYVIPFIQSPPKTVLRNNKSALIHSEFVYTAINDLLTAGCIHEISVQNAYVVNPLTVSGNTTGKKRLVLDLRHVNQFVEKQKVKFDV